jgi:hypothetical protein
VREKKLKKSVFGWLGHNWMGMLDEDVECGCSMFPKNKNKYTKICRISSSIFLAYRK